MGQIANQMVYEAFLKLKAKWKMKKAEKEKTENRKKK